MQKLQIIPQLRAWMEFWSVAKDCWQFSTGTAMFPVRPDAVLPY